MLVKNSKRRDSGSLGIWTVLPEGEQVGCGACCRCRARRWVHAVGAPASRGGAERFAAWLNSDAVAALSWR